MGPGSQTHEPTSNRRALLWRLSQWAGICAVMLAVLAVLFYVEENRRGRRSWETVRRHLAARGIELDWRKLGPAPGDEADNYTAFLAALFDYLPGTHTPRDLQAYNRVAGFAQTEPPYAEQRGPGDPPPPMVRGEKIDLAQALARLRKTQPRSGAASEPIPSGRAALAGSLLQALEPYRSVLEELRGASRRPHTGFNLNYAEDYPWRVSQPHLPVLKRIGRVLAWRGSAELALQDSAAAAEDVALEISLAAALKPEPLLSSFAARNVILFNARQIIWEGLASQQWSDEQLRDFQSRLAQFTLQDAQRYLAFERGADNAVFEFVEREPNVVRGWTLGPTRADKLHAFVLRHMPAGWMYLEQCAYERTFDELIAPALELDAGRIRPGLLEEARHPAFPILGHQLVVAPVASNGRYLLLNAALAQTGVNQAIIACALERYRLQQGALPENLTVLAPVGPLAAPKLPSEGGYFPGPLPLDVITGKPMHYKVAGDGQFTLYSVGWNETDDGGKLVLNQQKNATDPTQGDWLWPTSRSE